MTDELPTAEQDAKDVIADVISIFNQKVGEAEVAVDPEAMEEAKRGAVINARMILRYPYTPDNWPEGINFSSVCEEASEVIAKWGDSEPEPELGTGEPDPELPAMESAEITAELDAVMERNAALIEAMEGKSKEYAAGMTFRINNPHTPRDQGNPFPDRGVSVEAAEWEGGWNRANIIIQEKNS